jgi:hypothetical protein
MFQPVTCVGIVKLVACGPKIRRSLCGPMCKVTVDGEAIGLEVIGASTKLVGNVQFVFAASELFCQRWLLSLALVVNEHQ